MQKYPLVSVAMTSYNGKKYIEDQIMSITQQTYRNIEIIIVDDGSTDGSLDIINKLAAEDNRIKLYKNERNLGVVANLSKSTFLTSGDFICCCDQDDYWREDRIEILKNLIEKDDENMLAYSDLEISDENLKCIHPSYFKFLGIRPKRGRLRELSFLKNIVTGAAVMFRKEVKDELALVPADAPFMHDHLALIVASGLGKIVCSNERLVKYRQHEASTIGVSYPSVINKEQIIKGLRDKVLYFKGLGLEDSNLDLAKILKFCECLERGNFFERLYFLDYYLFLRKDYLKDKALGLFECLMPSGYAWLHRMKRLLPFIIRVMFTIWAFIVLWFFIKDFVRYKVIILLEHIKL